MPERLEDEIRRQAEAMYSSSTPPEHLIPDAMAEEFDVERPPAGPAVGLEPSRVRRRIPGWAIGLTALFLVLLLAIPVFFVFGGPDDDTVSRPDGGGGVEKQLYADGDINCPNNLADDLSTPVGNVVFSPLQDGVSLQITLESAAPNWEYTVHVLLVGPPGTADCWFVADTFRGFITDSQGNGVFTRTAQLDPGTYLVQVNIANETGNEPQNPNHREISQASLAEITVP